MSFTMTVPVRVEGDPTEERVRQAIDEINDRRLESNPRMVELFFFPSTMNENVCDPPEGGPFYSAVTRVVLERFEVQMAMKTLVDECRGYPTAYIFARNQREADRIFLRRARHVLRNWR